MTATVFQYQVRAGSRVIAALSFSGGDGRAVAGVIGGPDTASLYSRPGTTVRKLRVPKTEANAYDCNLFEAGEAVEAAREGRFGLTWAPYKAGG
jgi:hypothetical protein